MIFKLLLLFTLIPIIELSLLLKINSYIGIQYTLLIVVLTGLFGAYMAKREGRDIIKNIKFEMSQGRMPGDELINGLAVLIGGILLVAPGLLTDITGLIFVLPATRIRVISGIKRKIRNMITNRSVWFYFRR